MRMNVGIPRALAYHDYFRLWQVFFAHLGAELIVSPPTNQAIVNEGVSRAVDGTCFPVKIFYGHVHWLIETGVDTLFLPRLVSVAVREYICPKFMGLPDMVAAAFPDRPKIISPVVNRTRPESHGKRQIEKLSSELGCSSRDAQRALEEGLKAQHEYETWLQKGYWPDQDEQYPWQTVTTTNEHSRRDSQLHTFPSLRVGLLGHNYLIYDGFANMQMVSRLREMGTQVLTVDMLSPARLDAQATKWPKRMFWTSGRRILGAAWEYMETPVAGIVYITAFGCGTDSLTAELVQRTVRRCSKIPQLILNIDEHTGEAGIITRLEAFVDMLRWRQGR